MSIEMEVVCGQGPIFTWLNLRSRMLAILGNDDAFSKELTDVTIVRIYKQEVYPVDLSTQPDEESVYSFAEAPSVALLLDRIGYPPKDYFIHSGVEASEALQENIRTALEATGGLHFGLSLYPPRAKTYLEVFLVLAAALAVETNGWVASSGSAFDLPPAVYTGDAFVFEARRIVQLYS